MNNEKTVLPLDFDGVFRFTNFTKDEFKARWGGIEYTFPPEKTVPMIIPGATPEEVQYIRKKFARELAIVEFYKTEKFKGMNAHVPGGVPATYTDSDLAPFSTRCLEPLPVSKATLQELPKVNESRFRQDEEGNPVTKVLKKGESLKGGGSEVIA